MAHTQVIYKEWVKYKGIGHVTQKFSIEPIQHADVYVLHTKFRVYGMLCAAINDCRKYMGLEDTVDTQASNCIFT